MANLETKNCQNCKQNFTTPTLRSGLRSPKGVGVEPAPTHQSHCPVACFALLAGLLARCGAPLYTLTIYGFY